MKTEIITIGTEILMGEITNTNAQYLAQQCVELGLDVYYQTVVGDNKQRIIEALEIASQRANVIICTGGLGPTEDDITKECLATFLKCELYLDQDAEGKIKQFFANRNVKMSENNLRQATNLTAADKLSNRVGLAIGTAIRKNEISYLLLPGPPNELKTMFTEEAIPWIYQTQKQLEKLHTRVLCFAGIGESAIAEKLSDLITEQTDPTIATYAKEGEVYVRLASKQPSSFAKMEHEIQSRLGEYLYSNEEKTIEHTIVDLLERQSARLTVTESCTGGRIAQMITSISGSSKVFDGSLVTYSNNAKSTWLQIPRNDLDNFSSMGAISEATAKWMAEYSLSKVHANYSVSVTGVAGPTESEGKPVGTIFIGIASSYFDTKIIQLKLAGTRSAIQQRAAKYALYYLWLNMKNL